MAVSVELSKALDKAYENLSLAEILDAPVAALAGVSDSDAEHLAAAFNIKTVRDLGSAGPRTPVTAPAAASARNRSSTSTSSVVSPASTNAGLGAGMIGCEHT